jgi:hypothetical protein
MKKQHLLPILMMTAVFGTIIGLSSCGKIANLLNFKLTMQTDTVNVTIPVTSNTNGIITVGPTVSAYNVDSFIRANTGNQLGISNITSVKLNSVTFKLNNANSSNNFANFQSVSASFSSNTNSTPYTINIADNPDTYATTISLPVDTTVDLKTYLGNQFTYSISGQLRRPTTVPLNCTITFNFNVSVQG